MLVPLQHCFDSLAPHRYDSRFAPLTGDTHGPITQIDVAHIQVHQFGKSQAGGVEQLHERQIAHREWFVRIYIEQAPHLIAIERVRQPARRFRGANVGARVELQHLFADQIAEKAARSAQATLHAAWRKSRRMAACRKHPQVLVIERLPRFDLIAIAVLNQRSQFACVVATGVW